MTWKIDEIKITNFKFFHNEFKLHVERKNLLVYGENGSGKSSIYWSLYTLFQSALKNNVAEVHKYFDATNPQNLRNRFATAGDSSSVEVIYKDENGATCSDIVSDTNVSTLVTGRTFQFNTTHSSDFLNYKFLNAVFDFKNSEENDVFKIFESEVFNFLNFTKGCLKPDDSRTTTTSAKEWWNEIRRWPRYLPKSAGNRFVRGEQLYHDFGVVRQEFDEELAQCLRDIQQRTNTKLRDEFKLPVRIKLGNTPVEFDKLIPGTVKSRDQRLYRPKILLTVELAYENLHAADIGIEHPRSYFNEGKLTCVALALRLAIFEKRMHTIAGCAEILCIDDLLVSLDMSHRLPVIQILLKYAVDQQMMVFTHDRAFYELFKNDSATKSSI